MARDPLATVARNLAADLGRERFLARKQPGVSVPGWERHLPACDKGNAHAVDLHDPAHLVGRRRVAFAVGRVLPPDGGAEPLHAGAFIAGLLASPFLYEAATRAPVAQTVSDNVPLMIGAGLLVGLGTAVGSGCTSGHGVCGLSLFSPRSLVATLTFMAAGFVTVFLVRHAIGG